MMNATKCGSLPILYYILKELQFEPEHARIHSNNTTIYSEDLLYHAVISNHLEVVQFLCTELCGINWGYYAALTVAPLSHNIDILKYMLDICDERSQHVHPNYRRYTAFDNAASEGRLDMILLLEKRRPLDIEPSGVLHIAASRGHLNIFKGLKDSNYIQHLGNGLRVSLIDHASRYNQFEILKYVYDNGIDRGGTTNAIDQAAETGNLEMVVWFHENTTFGCTTKAMDNAAGRGYLEIVKYLHYNRIGGCTENAMNHAAWNGMLDTLEWLHHHRTEGCSLAIVDNVVKYGHLNILEWLHHNRKEQIFTKTTMDLAAEYGKQDILEWLHVNRTEGCSNTALERTIAKGELSVAKWLYVNRVEFQGKNIPMTIFNKALNDQRLPTLIFLLNNFKFSINELEQLYQKHKSISSSNIILLNLLNEFLSSFKK